MLALTGRFAGRVHETDLMPRDVNQNSEQIARDRIDDRLRAAGWHVQDKNAIDFNAGLGIAVREYQTDVGPADYVLFADRRPVGVVEAKPDSWGARLTTVELQSEGYANAKLKWFSSAEPLPFLYESTGQVTRFTNGREPQSALSRSLHVPPPRVVQELDARPAVLAHRHRRPSAAGSRRAARLPDRRHRHSGSLP